MCPSRDRADDAPEQQVFEARTVVRRNDDKIDVGFVEMLGERRGHPSVEDRCGAPHAKLGDHVRESCEAIFHDRLRLLHRPLRQRRHAVYLSAERGGNHHVNKIDVAVRSARKRDGPLERVLAFHSAVERHTDASVWSLVAHRACCGSMMRAKAPVVAWPSGPAVGHFTVYRPASSVVAIFARISASCLRARCRRA